MSTLEKLDSADQSKVETIAADWSTISNYCHSQVQTEEASF